MGVPATDTSRNYMPEALGHPPPLFYLIRHEKKNNKISDLFGVLCVVAIFAGCVEGLDGGVTLWTLCCLAAAGVFGFISKRTEDRHA